MASSTASSRPASSSRSRDAERDAGLPDLVLGADEPLAHGRRRDEERRGDRLRIQPQHHLQHQRRADADLDGRMRAGEHQRETMVGNFASAVAASNCSARSCNCAVRASPLLRRRADIDHLSAGDRHQPRFRVRRTAIQRPIRQRRSERLRQRILGLRHIARAGREKGDELAVAAARDRVRGAARLRVALPSLRISASLTLHALGS